VGKHTKSAGDQILFPPHCTRLTQIVSVAILLAIYQAYYLGIEAVQEPFVARLDAPVPLAMQKQRE
jgi:hypothetical protein